MNNLFCYISLFLIINIIFKDIEMKIRIKYEKIF